MTKKSIEPTKTASSKAHTAKAKSSKVIAKNVKSESPPVAKAAAAKARVAAPGKAADAVAKTVASKTVAKPAAPVKAAAKPVQKPAAPMAPRAPMPGQRAMPANGKAADSLTAPVANKGSAAQAAAEPKKSVTARHGFKTNELIVYPAHGVGRIIGIEEQEIAGISLELFVIEFEKDKMTLRVPTSKLASVGMRKLAEDGVVTKALDTLKGRARVKRTMWSRRAQEYEAKINSGDLVAIAEVVRDLYRSEAQPEQSYSERQLYEAALDRMARELAAVDRSDERSAMQRITEILAKSARGRRATEEGAAAAATADTEGAVKAA